MTKNGSSYQGVIMRRNIVLSLALGLVFTIIGFSCAKNSNDPATASKKLYIATGLCYSGTGFTAPTIGTVGQIVSRLDLSTHQYEVVHDYANLSEEDAGTYANGITDGGDGNLYIAVENSTSTGNRRIDKVEKAAFGTRSIWQPSTTYLAASTIRGIARASDQGFLIGVVSGTASIERFDATPTRKEAAPNISWGANNLGACASNNTRITDIVSLPKVVSTDTIGKYIYAHAAAGQMDVGVISKNGSNSAANCLANAPGAATFATAASTADPAWSKQLSANATPTSLVYIPTGSGTGKLLVAYSTNAVNTAAASGLNNALVMYDFTENTVAGETATLNNGVVLYNDVSYFYGVSAMAYDSSTGMLYVATSNSISANPPVGYNIEKFQISLTAPSATRIPNSNNSSFEASTSFNDCVTSMFVAD